MTTKKLTKRQLELLQAIEESINKNNAPPTIAELKKILGVSSDQSIYQLLDKLVDAGLARRGNGKKRGIRLAGSLNSNNLIGNQSKLNCSPKNMNMPLSMDPVQSEIFNKLHKINPDTASAYKGALYTLAQRRYHPDWIPQVANSLRGIFGILARDVADSSDNKKGKTEKTEEKESGTVKVSKSFDPHGGIDLKMTKTVFYHWNKLNRFFTRLSHYEDDHNTKASELLEKIDEFQKLLIKYILPDQSSIYDRIDRVIKSGPDSIKSSDLTKYLTRNIATHSYFFSKADYKWFDFLRNNKFLEPKFPVGEYIVKISSSIPEKVMDFIKKYNTEYNLNEDDRFIRYFFVEASLYMPNDISKKIVDVIKKQEWVVETTYGHDLFFYRSKSLLEMLIKNKDYDYALSLAEQILDVRNDERRGSVLRDVIGYVEEYFYSEIIKVFYDIPVGKLEPFIELLILKLKKGLKDSVNKKDDYSYIWRPKIYKNERYHEDVMGLLVDAIMDLFIKYLNFTEKKGGNDSGIINKLLKYNKENIFVRIGLHLYSKYPSHCNKDIERSIIEYFDNNKVRREYHDLVKQEFGNVNKETQNKYFDLILKGSQKKDFNDEGEYKRYWELGKLILVKKYLNSERKNYFDNLLGKDKESDFNPIYEGEITMHSGPTSPKGTTDLELMDINSLVKYLVDWKSDGEFNSPTRSGLGRVLSEVIKNDPEKHSDEALEFAEEKLHPVYLYQYFFGLREAIRNGKKINWNSVIELMEVIVDRAKLGKLPIFEKDKYDWNTEWGAVFQYMADLLENGFSLVNCEPPFTHREKIWNILKHICEENIPDLEYEKEYGYGNSEWYGLSINTPRGEGFNALFGYIFWCNRNNKKTKNGKIPDEVKEVLEDHLDIKKEPGLTIRSVYGRFFPWLYIFDPSWTKKIIPKLFPLDKLDIGRRYAAWEMYLINAVYSEIFDDLRPYYTEAILDLRKDSLKDNKRSVNPTDRLIAHLMIAYSHSIINYNDPLLKKFYEISNNKQKGVAINFVGRSYILNKNPDNISKIDKKRLESLWEMRIKDSNIEELKEFGWWLKKDYFDNEWMLKKILETLEKTKGLIKPDHIVFQVLEELANDYPIIVSKCLLKIIKARHEESFIYAVNENKIKDIVDNLYNIDNDEVSEIVFDISNQMLLLGHSNFRCYTSKPASI